MAWGVPKLGTLVEDATGNFDLIEPAGVAEGDLMVACIAYRGNAAITRPAGWEVVATQQNSGDTDAINGIASGAMFYIVRGSSAPDLTCVRTSGNVALARVISYSGGRPGTSVVYDTGSANTLGSASATATTGTFTVAEAGSLIVAMVSGGDAYTVSAFDAATQPAGTSGATDTTTAPTNDIWRERHDSNTGTGADATLAIADGVKSFAGATGTIQATVSGSARQVMIAGAFKLDNTLSINKSESVTVTESIQRLAENYVNRSDSISVKDVLTGTMDSYSESNGDGGSFFNASTRQFAQSFTGNGESIAEASVPLNIFGSPTGEIQAQIYSGAGSVPSSLIETSSNTVDMSTLTTEYVLTTFSFSPVSTTNGTKYWVVLSLTGSISVDGTKGPQWQRDNSSPTHTGSGAIYTGSWSSETNDKCFYVFSQTPAYTVSIEEAAGDKSVNKSDSITITESKQLEMESYVNKSDSVSVAESVNVALVSDVNVSDSASLTESLKLETESYINVSDGSTITEATALLIPELYLSVSDSATVAESTKQEVESFINKSDGIAVAESTNLTIAQDINVSDSVAVAEALQRVLESYVNKTESIGVAESVSLLIPDLYVNKSDNVSVAEFVQLDVTVTISKSDSIGLAESVTVRLESNVPVSDSAGVAEALKLEGVSFINESEAIGVAESVTVSIEAVGARSVNVSDSVGVAEFVSLLIPELFITASESSSVTEAVSVALVEAGGIAITASDNVSIAESTQLLITELHASVSDSSTVTESVNISIEAVPDLSVNVADNATISESVAVLIETLYIVVQDSSSIAENVQVAIAAGGATGNIKVRVGASFVAKPVKHWNGSAWVIKPVKYFDGADWTITSY